MKPFQKTHGMTGTRIHRIWKGMVTRCHNPNANSFEDYGRRGIRVCDRWRSFEAFYADMGDAPSETHSLNRVDNDGSYEPGNVVWSTASEQGRNNRHTKIIEHGGKRMSMIEWSEVLGIKYKTLQMRIQRGWHPSVALTLSKDQAMARMPGLGAARRIPDADPAQVARGMEIVREHMRHE